MPPLAIPTTVETLTPAWLTQALAPSLGGASIISVAATSIGTGQVGENVRLRLEFSAPTTVPRSLVAKLPSTSETSRAAAGALRTYEVEVRFYQELAETLPVRTPRCYHAAIDLDSNAYVLLLEDLAPAAQGNQLAGCSPDQAATAVLELPKLHAPRWGDPQLAAIGWLARVDAEQQATMSALLASLFPGFCERYQDRLASEVLALGERLFARMEAYAANRPGPWTIQHGDYRLDNLLFATAEGGDPVAVVDWQVVTHGPAVADVAYFLGAGLVPDQRRAHEASLVREYYGALCAAGVSGYGWDECWRDYRRYAFAGFVMAVAASMIVERTTRGDEMFVAMASRHGQHALDLEAEDLLG